MPSKNITPSTSDYDMLEALDAEPPVDNFARKSPRISKTRNWKQVDKYIEERIKVYREFLPGINPAITGSNEDWRVADSITRELEQLRNIVDDITNGIS